MTTPSLPGSSESKRDVPTSPIWTVDDEGLLVWRGIDRMSSTWVAEMLGDEDGDRVSADDGFALVQLVKAAGEITARRCDIYTPPFTCLSESEAEPSICDPCRLNRANSGDAGAHDATRAEVGQ